LGEARVELDYGVKERNPLFAGDHSGHGKQISESAAKKRERSADHTERTGDAFAECAHREPDEKSYTDGHEPNLIPGGNSDTCPHSCADDSRNEAADTSHGEVLL